MRKATFGQTQVTELPSVFLIVPQPSSFNFPPKDEGRAQDGLESSMPPEVTVVVLICRWAKTFLHFACLATDPGLPWAQRAESPRKDSTWNMPVCGPSPAWVSPDSKKAYRNTY